MANPPVISTPTPFDRILTGEFRNFTRLLTIRPQGTSDWLIIQTIGGGGRLVAEGKSFDLLPGDIVLSRPDSPHFYQTHPRVKRWDLLWAHFHPRPEWREWLRWPHLAGGWGRLQFKGTLHRKIRDRLRQMHRYGSRPPGRGRHDLLAMNALEEVLLWCDEANESRRPGVDGPTEAVLELIAEHYAERLSLRFLAQKSGQSVARLTRQFRKYVGSSPQAAIEAHRLDRAGQLLARTALSIKEIADQTGFSNPFYFSIRFKKAAGLGPRAYRKRVERQEPASGQIQPQAGRGIWPEVRRSRVSLRAG